MTTISRLYYDGPRPSGFSTLRKLRSATVKKSKPKSDDVITDWLVKRNAYGLLGPVRKHFARNSCTVSYVMNVWECDLLDVQAYAKYNDNYRYILSVIEVFSKYLHLIPIKIKRGPSVATAFR